ncbi:MAG: peptidoglycan-binding protein [Oscillospiraceae bacterium]|nr:peptidoglycan-binding protein [Oscillospiraceae bacterium]
MGKKSELIKKAQSYLGANYKHFCNAFWGGSYPWCASFVAVCGRESGNGDVIPWTTSCTSLVSWYKVHGGYLGKTTDITVGDLVLYEFENPDDGADHIGIVVEVRGNMIKVIEGNKGNKPSDQTRVEYREIPKDWPYICEVCRPKYDKEIEKEVTITVNDITIKVKQIQTGSAGSHVMTLQHILIGKGYSCGACGADGEYGPDSRDAVIRYQRDNHLTEDGVVGVNTWTKILS